MRSRQPAIEVQDERIHRLARVLVDYSTRTKPGDRVWVVAQEIASLPFAVAVHRRAVEVGAFPYVEFTDHAFDRQLLTHGTLEQVGWVPEPSVTGIDWADVYIGLRALPAGGDSDLPPERLVARRHVLGQLAARRTAGTRWVLAPVPTMTLAERAGESLEVLTDAFFAASLRDWDADGIVWRERAERMQAGSRVRIIGQDTDLSFSTEGRTYVVADGHLNMPDGEIYTAPVDDSAEGWITFEGVAHHAGAEIARIRLRFEHGRVVESAADSGEDVLRGLIDMDAGARRIGEFGVGTNDALRMRTGEILLDEKIEGTIHIALGRAYRECGGVNASALHWDIVKDLRPGGAVLVDGQPVLEYPSG